MHATTNIAATRNQPAGTPMLRRKPAATEEQREADSDERVHASDRRGIDELLRPILHQHSLVPA